MNSQKFLRQYKSKYNSYDKVKLEEINGKKYLAKKNKKGEIQLYDPIVKNPKVVGTLDPINGKIKYKNKN